ncbi:HD domain-containing protein [Streptomyces sp. NPDC002536]
MRTTPPAESLVELAARKQLPRHQYTDHATVRWIEAHRPVFSNSPVLRLRPAVQQLVLRAAIPTAWLAEPRLADSLHGIRHAMRTAALAAVLAEAEGLPEDATATLVMAAAVHDCRRFHDKDDRGHGARAATWLAHSASTVCQHFQLAATARRINTAQTAVRLHERPYDIFTCNETDDYSQAQDVTDLLKAADALDRYRLPKLSWWPDATRVRCSSFASFQAAAFELVVASEAAHLAGLGSADAVAQALEAWGLRR